MWRPPITFLRKVVNTPLKKTFSVSKLLYSTRSNSLKPAKLTLLSAGIGVLLGAGYGGYTHYKINAKKITGPAQTEDYPFLEKKPKYQPHYKIVNESDTSDLQLVLFQYRTCPFCCKVRSYLDARGISYEVVEVDAVLRQDIRWSNYKKVPILLAKVDGGYQQLLDSTAIISVLETYLRDKSHQLTDVVKFYPIAKYDDENGKSVVDITNKYFIMHNASVPNTNERTAEAEERQWRQWADKVLVHTLSPNVYRTAGEALETFKWFEEVGGWRQSFPSWECALMVYGGAAAMWIIAKRLKARHNIKDDVRQSLYDAANEWMKVINTKGTPFLGGKEPNLADISVFGVLSSIEGCQAFKDLKMNTKIGVWFEDMKKSMDRSRGKALQVTHA
ncbi:prostaglandin E synthase 2 [Aricia agestis]|uniref:prostaglandin E synthase 2 n=1 Tax=Aricia agestis TaxID=91739 RepID=UPI001C205070|nr:prostaglandin E synthase 2 [Aricia agestis]